MTIEEASGIIDSYTGYDCGPSYEKIKEAYEVLYEMKKPTRARCMVCRDAGYYQYPYQIAPDMGKPYKYCQCVEGDRAKAKGVLDPKKKDRWSEKHIEATS